jgi:protein TonB
MGTGQMGTDHLSLRPFLLASLLLHLVLALLPVGRMAPQVELPRGAPGHIADAGYARRDLAALGLSPISVVEFLVSGERLPGGEAAAPRDPLAEEPSEVIPVADPVAVESRALPAEPALFPVARLPDRVARAPDGSGLGRGAEGGEAGQAGPGERGRGDDQERLVPPVVIAMSWPEYPRGARKRSTIPIVLAVHVNAAGEVDEVRVESGGDCPPCEEAAIASAWRMRFLPATRGGLPVAAWTRVPVTFRRR